jgi:hypothetical protein
MLGFSPISSQPISGGPFSLIRVPLEMASAVSFAFTLTARIGAFIPISASIGITFNGSPTLYVEQAISATVSFAFSGTPTLHIAGKPIKLAAIPQSYNLRAARESYSAKALPSSHTIRGAR